MFLNVYYLVRLHHGRAQGVGRVPRQHEPPLPLKDDLLLAVAPDPRVVAAPRPDRFERADVRVGVANKHHVDAGSKSKIF